MEEVPTRVFSAEHLACIALETGRPKDKARLLQFMEAAGGMLARFRSACLREMRLTTIGRTGNE